MPAFSYGSNLDPLQLRARCPRWDGQGLVARLDGWRWGITKRSLTGAGFAGIVPEADSHCWGVVHHLFPQDLAILDAQEGVGTGCHYEREAVVVSTAAGEQLEVLVYVPVPPARAEGLLATAAYAARIRLGADHWELPGTWRQTLVAALRITV
ncbi:MAG: hypothetical protein ER33_05795 [Cyanobium sp. CACIAM 14]|nr:MAG: hypothetical protein ER33_05795 [Cyanobium sp. CACIAM 14]